MSSLATIGRMSGRVSRRSLTRIVTAPRGFRTSAAALAAQNFTMPALSPTMTEGNIGTWRVKEGEKFSAGDVLLEIETDKATMDVEAQDEGILMKIMQGDGTKAVKVGARIAVLAEEGDDISSLEIPPDESAAKAQQEQQQKQPPKSESSSQNPEKSQATPAEAVEAAKKASSGGSPSKVIYPLLPSVAQLVKEKGIDESTVAQITPTGPNGRLLKGDILAHLGSINQQTPATISERFQNLSRMDLSNINFAKPAVAAQKAAAAKDKVPAKASEPSTIEVSLPISFDAATQASYKLKKAGIETPVFEFFERAVSVANEALPVPANYQPTADELFDQVLGLADGTRPAVSRGNYQPSFFADSEYDLKDLFRSAPRRQPQPDIIDELAGPSRRARNPARQVRSVLNSLSMLLNVPRAEEKRAKVFLQRVKQAIENEPESLALID